MQDLRNPQTETMDSAYFIIKKNDILKKVSYGFLKELGCMESSIMNEKLTLILPECIMKVCDQIEHEVIQKQDDKH